jgi:LDH2 family malate/lactate/ureidoglycolate dehydrogenase
MLIQAPDLTRFCEPELRIEAVRTKEGIPVEDGNWKALADTATRLGVRPVS